MAMESEMIFGVQVKLNATMLVGLVVETPQRRVEFLWDGGCAETPMLRLLRDGREPLLLHHCPNIRDAAVYASAFVEGLRFESCNPDFGVK